MAGKKFSEFNGVTAMGAATSFLVGYDTVADTNNRWDRTAIAGWVGPAISIDTIFTTSPSSTVPTTQILDLADNITFNHTAGATAACIWKTTSNYGNIAIIPAGLGGVGGGSSPGLYWDWSGYTNIIRTYTGSPGKNVELGHSGIATVSINPWTNFWLSTAGLTVASTSATTTGVQIRGGSDADTSKALLVENDSGTETFSVRDDGLVTVANNLKVDGQTYNDGVHDIGTIAGGGTATPDWDNGNIQKLTIDSSGGAAAITLANAASTMTAGATYILIIIQGGTAAGTISSYGTHYKFPGATAPTLTTGTANQADVITMVAYSSTVLMCTSTLNFVTS